MEWYRRFHFLSLDIVAGALGMSLLAARLLDARPGWAWYACLVLTVWLLYTGDHVLDAWRHRKQGVRELHRFIFHYRKPLLFAMGAVALADSVVVLNTLPRELLRWSLALGGLVLLFYTLRHILRRNKLFFVPGEFFVLLIYLAGTWLGPMVFRESPMGPVHWLLLLLVALVLVMNLGIISLYDVDLDSRMGITSLARILGAGRTRNLILSTAGAVVVLTLLLFMVYGLDPVSLYGLIPLGMALLLLVVLLYPSRFRKKEAYRMSADAVLYLSYFALAV